MKNSLKKLLALLSAMLILFSFAACGDKKDAEKTTGTTAAEEVDVEEETEEAEDVEAQNEETEAEKDTKKQKSDKKGTTKAKTKKSSDNSVSEKTTKSAKKKTGQKKSGKKSSNKKTAEKTTEKTTKKKKNSNEQSYSTAEIVKIYNDSANLIKSERPGYNKKHIQKVMGSTSGIPEKLLTLFTVDDDKNIKKGKSSDDEYPVSGYEWASHMKASDIKTAKMENKNGKYIINITFGKENDPKKDASKYGRVMSVIDVTEAKKISLGLITDASMVYHDGYIKAEIDCKTGKMISAELSATADVEAQLSKVLGGKKISVKDIRSTETFTNFDW